MGAFSVKLKWTGIQSNKQFVEQTRLESLFRDKQQLIKEIRDAHQNWLCAQARFELALGIDQIDYAIIMLEAAEKRYSMLLKQAKELHFNEADRENLLEVRMWSSNT
jgi:Protein of unknown function (DUF2508)